MLMRAMSSPPPPRFNSGLHQRDSRSALFEGYTGSGADNRRGVTPSPSRPGGGYGYGFPAGNGTAMNGNLGVENRGFRPATPNKRSVFLGGCLSPGPPKRLYTTAERDASLFESFFCWCDGQIKLTV